jgi:hypothetical protein
MRKMKEERNEEEENREVYLQNALPVCMYPHNLHGPVQQLLTTRNFHPFMFQTSDSELVRVLPSR